MASAAVASGVAVGVAGDRDAYAQNAFNRVSVTIDPGAGQELVNLLGIDIADLETQLGSRMAESFSLLRPTEYLRAMADAQAFSNKGLGVDYGTTFDYVMLGVAASAAITLGDVGFQEVQADQPVGGMTPNVTVMAGLNLGIIGLEWLNIYGNFFTMDFAHEQLTAQIRNFGIHGQLLFFRPDTDDSPDSPEDTEAGETDSGLLQWGGIAVTSGYQWSYLGFTLEDNLETALPLAGEGDADVDVDATMVSTGTFEISNVGNSIPIEVSTSLRFLWIAGLFAGVGFDVQLGGSEMKINLDGDLTAVNPQDGSTIDLGSASVTATAASQPSAARIRFMAGAHIHLWVLHLFFQANILPERAVSAAFGARFAI